ncbi:unnamed protein product [Clonostachys chloroleuca]|uniref:Uncharacterized protein n=1 Tax=Clonostachys chloroleuca TaxID=1926264 RepID=A0AA35QEZ1_9HYPO|nr:unnamed protein product [Clonostachys chloroleuca]
MDWMPADPTFLPNDWRIFGYKEEGAQDARAIRKLQKDEWRCYQQMKAGKDGFLAYVSPAVYADCISDIKIRQLEFCLSTKRGKGYICCRHIIPPKLRP